MANYPFTLSAYVRANSGGHNHTDNRPTGRFIDGQDTVTTLSAVTGSMGSASYVYLCSGIGGVDSFFVQGRTKNDTATAIITLKMGDFSELTEGEHYVLTGANAGGSQHSKNHFGNPSLLNHLEILADTVYAKKKYRLRYNDMSLADGGPFDYTNNWNTPHQTHREGVSVDISNVALTQTNTTRSITATQLNYWMKSIGINSPNIGKEGTHFHVTIR